jgi:hypothetical protein
VAVSRRNAAGLTKAFADFGFRDLGLREADFMEPDKAVSPRPKDKIDLEELRRLKDRPNPPGSTIVPPPT